MRIADILYFAPGIRFDQVDLRGPALPNQYRDRMSGFYVEPAEQCASHGHAFAAGVLLVSCIDALARTRFNSPKVGDRIKRFAREELQSFSAGGLATRFYEDFRNGLVHEARIKNGGQFSLDISSTVERAGSILLINPARLGREVRSAIDGYAELLERDRTARQRLERALARDHARDFAAA